MSRQAWVEAALEAIARVGVARLAVEPLAKALGTTKGSFYWHFADRSELVAAALARWEEIATRQVVVDVSGVDARERPARLVEAVFAAQDSDSAEWRILAAVDDPQVAPVVERVHVARVAFVEQVCRDLGMDADTARTRARLAYATYLGHLYLRFAATDVVASISHDEIAALLTRP